MSEWWLDPPEPDIEHIPICPVCNTECSDIYKDRDGNVCGCENCIKICPADMEPECVGGDI